MEVTDCSWVTDILTIDNKKNPYTYKSHIEKKEKKIPSFVQRRRLIENVQLLCPNFLIRENKYKKNSFSFSSKSTYIY